MLASLFSEVFNDGVRGKDCAINITSSHLFCMYCLNSPKKAFFNEFPHDTFSTSQSMRTKRATIILLSVFATRTAEAMFSKCLGDCENPLSSESFQTLKTLCNYVFPDWLDVSFFESKLVKYLPTAVVYYDIRRAEDSEAA